VYARPYAQILGVVLILVGLVGLALGNQVWGGILNVDIAEDIVHLITGSVLAYVGFGPTELSVTRNGVGWLGIIYLMVGVLGFASPTMFGLIPHGYTAFDNLLHLFLGGLSLAVAWWFFADERDART
jgi:drug/metabolite transporter (DMT)-like permease